MTVTISISIKGRDWSIDLPPTVTSIDQLDTVLKRVALIRDDVLRHVTATETRAAADFDHARAIRELMAVLDNVLDNTESAQDTAATAAKLWLSTVTDETESD